jgi:hypothetical protein
MKAKSHKRNHAAWIGPVIVLTGVFTYFSVAVQYPTLRDSALVNLVVVYAGLLIAAVGLFRRRNWKSWLGLCVAGFFTMLFSAYIFVYSSQLPPADNAPAVGSIAPPLELPDHTGRMVSLDTFRGARVLVVFYRGFW